MKRKYEFKGNGRWPTVVSVILFIPLMIWFVMAAVFDSVSAMGLWLLTLIGVIAIDLTIPCYYDAGETSVTFSILGKKTRINYRDIQSVEVCCGENRSPVDKTITFVFPFEKLVIQTYTKRYVFCAKLRDFSGRGCMTELKDYIDERIGLKEYISSICPEDVQISNGIKGKFRHTSLAIYLFTLPMLGSLFLAEYAVIDEIPYSEFGLYLGIFLLSCIGLLLSIYAPFRFEADESSVVFKELIPPRKRRIYYSDIKSIELTREYINSRGESRIEETIIFHLSGGSVRYTQDNIGIDLRKCSDQLSEITDELNNSLFSQLKRFIESKMDTIQGGRSNV